MGTGIDPKVDYIFKMIFGSQANIELLENMLNAVLRPPADRRIDSLTICNPFNDKETLDDKLSILDIKARDQRGGQYNIEMQMVSTPILIARLLYYWAVLHSDQLHEGDDYQALQPTISICFVNDVLFPETPDYHLDFQLRSSADPRIIYSEHQSMHVLELPKFTKTVDELADALDHWCYFLVHGAELDLGDLPPALSKSGVRRALEVLTMVTQNDLERERYQARLKAQRDARSYLRDAREVGFKEGEQHGRQEGRQEGLQEGVLVGKIHLCQRLLKQRQTPREELEALSLPELTALADQLERQLGIEPANDS